MSQKEDFVVLSNAVDAFVFAVIGLSLIPIVQFVFGLIALSKTNAIKNYLTRESEVIFVHIARPIAIIDIILGGIVIVGGLIWLLIWFILLLATGLAGAAAY